MRKPYTEYCHFAAISADAGRFNDAIGVAGEGLVEHPDNIPLMELLSFSLHSAKRHYEAALVLKRMLEINPDTFGARGLLAQCYVDIGIHNSAYWDKAIEASDLSIEKDKEDSSGYVSKAFIALQRAEYEECFSLCQEAIKINPETDGGVFNIAIAMLANHMWEEGWFSYNKYLHPRFKAGVPKYKVPLWEGQPGKLIVTAEQGLGDVIMFASMIPDLQKDHEIVFDTVPKSAGLLARSFDCEAHATKIDETAIWKANTDADYWVPIGSLGAYFRNSAEDFPGTPYLKADPDRRLQWKALLDSLSDKPKIGIAWSGGVIDTNEVGRSMSLRELFPILEYDAEWISLQYKNTHDIPDYIHHWPRAVENPDYEETVALIAELDLVITVTTTAVHCAGALGKETWALVPEAPAWRYGTSGDKMPWYNSVELLREKDGIWPIQEVCERLSAMGIEKCRKLSMQTPITVLPRSNTHRLSPPSSNSPGLQKYLIMGLGKAA